MKKIAVNSNVLCRFYNGVQHKFYDKVFTARVIEIIEKHKFTNTIIEKGYRIITLDGMQVVLKRKEIIRNLDNNR